MTGWWVSRAPLGSSPLHFCSLCPHLSSCQRPWPVDLVRDTPLALPGAHVAPICQEDDESVPLEPSRPIMRAGERCAVCSGTSRVTVTIFVLVVSTAAISVPDRGSFYHVASRRQRVGKYVLHEWDAYRTAYMEFYDRYIFEQNVFQTASGWIQAASAATADLRFHCAPRICSTFQRGLSCWVTEKPYRESKTILRCLLGVEPFPLQDMRVTGSDLLKMDKQLYELE